MSPTLCFSLEFSIHGWLFFHVTWLICFKANPCILWIIFFTNYVFVHHPQPTYVRLFTWNYLKSIMCSSLFGSTKKFKSKLWNSAKLKLYPPLTRKCIRLINWRRIWRIFAAIPNKKRYFIKVNFKILCLICLFFRLYRNTFFYLLIYYHMSVLFCSYATSLII